MTKLQIAKEEVSRIDEAMGQLAVERRLWASIVARESSIPQPAIIERHEAAKAQEEESPNEEYGGKTNALRRFMISRPNGVTMRELRTEARKYSDLANMPYRFVDRMEKSGELTKREDGVYVATSKMFQVMGDKR